MIDMFSSGVSVVLHDGSTLTPLSTAASSSHLKDGPRARLNDTHLLIFAAGGQQAAVRVEGHAEDDVSMAVDHLHRLSDLQVPDQDLSQSGGSVWVGR